MNNLLVDIGNSSMKYSFAHSLRLGTIGHYSGQGVLNHLIEAIAQKRVESIAISSVRNFPKGYFAPLKKFSKSLILVEEELNMPHLANYRSPETLGADRVMGTLAAIALFPKRDLILFDFGTALTVDLIDFERHFVGGNISPGFDSRFEILHSSTGLLPRVTGGDSLKPYGTSTQEAIENGVALSLLYEVEGYLREYPTHLPIFTGGDAIYFAKKMKSTIFVVYNLVLMGLAHLAIDYANKK
ncbi:MAG: type III pantothenate kinase [Bacteroidales bacterium]